MGNIRRARELFDAATVADKRHIAAWHGWATLELKQGNIKKARNLLGKGLKYCGGNEYIYQSLALLEAKAKRYEQARYLFRQATKCNPRSCASWLVSILIREDFPSWDSPLGCPSIFFFHFPLMAKVFTPHSWHRHGLS